jgi:hypothetical protein
MSRQSWGAVVSKALIVALVSPPFSAHAQAPGGLSAGYLAASLQLGQPIERVQYFSLGGNDYCWYSGGWNGPGWYECGDQGIYGLGWGGAYGWNGWGGGTRIQPYRYHSAGVYHPGRPPVVDDPLGDPIEGADLEPRRSYEGLPNRFRVPVRPGVTEHAVSDGPEPKALLEASRPFGHQDLPRYPDFAVRPDLPDETTQPFHGLSNSPTPVFHGLGGGDGLHDFGFHNSGEFHGSGIHADAGIGRVGGFAGFHPIGGGMFSGGHIGGIGHR